MKNIKVLPSKSKLSTPTDLGEKAQQAIAKVINPLVADALALYVKSKNYHWHVSGSHYRDYHLLLDEQATQVLAMVDILAERIRKLGGTTIHSIGHIHQLTRIEDDNNEFVEPREMLIRLLTDNKNFNIHLREAHEVCDEYNDVATASILEIFIDETERRIWFLFETASV